MTYAVIAPAKTYSGTQVVPVHVTDDIDEAKSIATRRRAEFEKKGWDAWAKQVKIQSPKNAEGHWELAEQLAAYAHQLDMASGGNSFKAQEMIGWVNTLKARADEMANPYNAD